MRITIVCVGKLKEKYWQDAIAEYSKRLSRYHKLEIVELPDEKAPETMSPAQEEEVKKKEGERILKAIKDDAFVVALAIEGKGLTSEGLADFMAKKAVGGVSHMAFVIGGSLGLSKEVMKRADFALSFSAMTFPHQMMRVILLEQIYRAERINRKEPPCGEKPGLPVKLFTPLLKAVSTPSPKPWQKNLALPAFGSTPLPAVSLTQK